MASIPSVLKNTFDSLVKAWLICDCCMVELPHKTRLNDRTSRFIFIYHIMNDEFKRNFARIGCTGKNATLHKPYVPDMSKEDPTTNITHRVGCFITLSQLTFRIMHISIRYRTGTDLK